MFLCHNHAQLEEIDGTKLKQTSGYPADCNEGVCNLNQKTVVPTNVVVLFFALFVLGFVRFITIPADPSCILISWRYM